MDKGEVVFVIRNLPFNLEKEKFSLSISTAFSEETVKIIEYIQGKKGTKEIIPTRCYVKIYNKIGTKSSDSFLDFMDGKSFVNNKGIEEQCSVENVPFFLNLDQDIKKNTSMGTLESSKTYQSFLKQLDLPTDSVQNFDTKSNTNQESWPIVDMILKRDNKKEKREKKDREKKRKRDKKRKRSKRQKQKQKLLQKQQQESGSVTSNTSSTQNITTILSPSSSSSSIPTSNTSQNVNNSGNKSKSKRQPKEKQDKSQQQKEKKPRERKPKDKSNNNNNTASTTTTTTTATAISTTNTPTTPSKSNKTPKEKQFREKKPSAERKPKSQLVYEPKIKQSTASNPPPPST